MNAAPERTPPCAPGGSNAASATAQRASGDGRLPWSERWTLPGGKAVTVRPVLPQDQALAIDFVGAGLTPHSRYLRFMVGMRELPLSMARYLTDVDHRTHVALIVESCEDGVPRQVGEGRYVHATDAGAIRSAEFALAVADPWQGQGLGRRLLQTLLAMAARQGVQQLYGDVLRNNRVMLRLAQSSGFRTEAHALEPRLLRVQRELAQDGILLPATTARHTRRPANDGVWDRFRRRNRAAGS